MLSTPVSLLTSQNQVCAPRASGVSRRSSPPGSDGGVGDESFCSYNDPNDSSYIYSEGDIGDDTVDLIDPVDPHNPPASDRVLRFPRRNWLLEGDLPTDPKSCEQNPDNCDNGGSGNCVLFVTFYSFLTNNYSSILVCV